MLTVCSSAPSARTWARSSSFMSTDATSGILFAPARVLVVASRKCNVGPKLADTRLHLLMNCHCSLLLVRLSPSGRGGARIVVVPAALATLLGRALARRLRRLCWFVHGPLSRNDLQYRSGPVL